MRRFSPSLALALLTGLALASSANSAGTGDEPIFCGGETTRAEAQAYFVRLDKALAADASKSRFNAFVAPIFGVTDARGRHLYFRRADFNSVTPGRIRIEEWRQISARGLKALRNAGWRGCMMSHGKVWFETSETNGLELKGFNRTLAWDPSEL
ncbi:hypothetical protein [Erythrobacter colymbi]|uniref:hypothetical protein n=1 Tax=Erythrobacter colymbi TaxID=1161202 RepID=UPI000A3A5912|nr:hypothetical protein [Erythrobacter colymbi]